MTGRFFGRAPFFSPLLPPLASIFGGGPGLACSVFCALPSSFRPGGLRYVGEPLRPCSALGVVEGKRGPLPALFQPCMGGAWEKLTGGAPPSLCVCVWALRVWGGEEVGRGEGKGAPTKPLGSSRGCWVWTTTPILPGQPLLTLGGDNGLGLCVGGRGSGNYKGDETRV